MATNVTKAPHLEALVKPVRALLRKKQYIQAIKLVRERTAYHLKEAKDFVDHVKARPGAKAENVAGLWLSTTIPGSLPEATEPEPQPFTAHAQSEANGPQAANDRLGNSWATFYVEFMQTHTYAEWEQLIEQVVALKQAKESPTAQDSGELESAE
jgi:hypothetical protein